MKIRQGFSVSVEDFQMINELYAEETVSFIAEESGRALTLQRCLQHLLCSDACFHNGSGLKDPLPPCHLPMLPNDCD